jgi:hypothetical protein
MDASNGFLQRLKAEEMGLAAAAATGAGAGGAAAAPKARKRGRPSAAGAAEEIPEEAAAAATTGGRLAAGAAAVERGGRPLFTWEILNEALAVLGERVWLCATASAVLALNVCNLAPRRRAAAPRYLGISFCFSRLQNKSKKYSEPGYGFP